MFLTDPELRDLTGYRRNAERIAWLKRNGVPFYVRADGFPVVLRRDLERVTVTTETTAPDFGALRA